MEKIEYKSEFIDLIKDLTVINKTVIVEKRDGKAVSYRSDPDVRFVYNIEANPDFFNINDETKLGFYDFTEFYQFFMTFKEPEMFVEGNKIIFKNGSSKGDYILSDIENLKNNQKYGKSAKIKFEDYDFSVKLNSNDIIDLVKLNGLLQSTKAKIYTKDNKLNVKLYNHKHENTYEKSFEFINESGYDQPIEFDIMSEIFEKLPVKRNYVLKIKKDGFVLFTLINDNINMNVFTGPVRS